MTSESLCRPRIVFMNRALPILLRVIQDVTHRRAYIGLSRIPSLIVYIAQFAHIAVDAGDRSDV